jgi:hypothetical protein
MKNYRSTIIGFAVLVILLTAGAAQSLDGSNTVFGDDIVDGTITTPDLKVGSISGSRLLDSGITSSKIYDNTITGVDVNEATLALPAGDVLAGTAAIPPGTYSFHIGTSIKSTTAKDDVTCQPNPSGSGTSIHTIVNTVVVDLAANVDTYVTADGIVRVPVGSTTGKISFGCGTGVTKGDVSVNLIRLGKEGL